MTDKTGGTVDLDALCTCEFGFRLGDGRTDSNRCIVHDMTHEELLMVVAYDRQELEAREATIDNLTNETWLALAPYIASEETEYSEEEMEHLCESVLPNLWGKFAPIRTRAREGRRELGGEESDEG